VRLSVATLALLLAGTAPATAAPTLAPLKSCYVSVGRFDPATGDPDSEPIDLAGDGFTPGAKVTAFVDGTIARNDLVADPSGAVLATVPAPLQDTGEREFTVTLAERDRPENAVTAASRVTMIEVTAKPRTARPTSRVTFVGRGFTDLKRPVWGHYTRNGRDRRTVRFTRRPKGPCGTFTVRRRQMPFKQPATGRWILRVDQKSRYRADFPGPFAPLEIFVRPRPRPAGRHG
jgi:hypothetical protein